MTSPSLDTLRMQIIEQALPRIASEGWRVETLLAATDSPQAEMLFANASPFDLVALGHQLGDERLKERLERENLSAMRVRDRVKSGIKWRLEPWTPHRQAIARALPILMRPENTAKTAQLIWKTCDLVWKYAGDTATDWNYYTKRGLLAAVYSSTLPVWLEDSSEECAQSWQFLENRIENALDIGRKSSQLGAMLAKCAKKITARL